MKTTVLLGVLLSLASVAPAYSQEDASGYTTLKGAYRTYSRGIGDPGEPTAADTKIMFAIDGKAAREMFDAMGKDVKDACTEGSGTRVRTRDQERLWCSRSKQGVYSCNFGFDLKSGKSIGGIVC
ncbi:hypothetical protein [Massilia scottii]|uniref:hypothetical protein n=1 Tax=Massilia scottii TaxID=3057166 RepID=UPI002796CB5E|nr:hypothetical protein [Massilia sp. CCM 9029]MDQ1834872.1 hypothetical protein [Massilia sp. CCM 9029]